MDPLEAAVEKINRKAGYQAVSISSLGGVALQGVAFGAEDAPKVADPIAVAAVLAPVVACGTLNVRVVQPELLDVLPHLSLSHARVELDFPTSKADQTTLAALGEIANLEHLTLRKESVLAGLPRVESLARLSMRTEPIVNPDFAQLAALFPNLTMLDVAIDEEADWVSSDLAQLTGLTALFFSVDQFRWTSHSSLQGVSLETLNLVLEAVDVLPNLETLNEHNAHSVTASDLGAGSARTRDERHAAASDQAAIDRLREWGWGVANEGWPTSGTASTIAGPVLVLGFASSPVRAVKSEDWWNISASDLCATPDDCRSVIIIEHRPGGIVGHYKPVGNKPGFPAYKGETTITVYDLATSQARPLLVVARTDPPDKAARESQGIGPPDLGTATAYIADHLQ